MLSLRVHSALNGARRALAAPSRNARTAVVLGRLLGAAFLICFATGIYSHYLQEPLPWMRFPTRPTFLYQLTQGIHITAGIACFPLIFGKLYAIFPLLFQSPPVRSFPHLLERASIALFVSASLVQIATGLLNTYQWYALFPFPFRQTHYALSYVIIGSLAIHIALKLPVIAEHWRKPRSASAGPALAGPAPAPGRGASKRAGEAPDGAEVCPAAPPAAPPAALTEAGAPAAAPAPATPGATGRVLAWIDSTPPSPSPTASRRGFFTIIGIATAAVVGLTAGQSFRVLDGVNLFGARKKGTGTNGLPVNRTARAAKVLDTATAPDWTLTVTSAAASAVFTRQQLEDLPQFEVRLPIACVEGWSQTAIWSGPRLRDLVDAVGADPRASMRATSLEQDSSYAVTTMGPEYVRDELTLVALRLEGETLDIDHGYPARLIAPGRPGVMQTKWLSTLEMM
ncbi:MAG: molybdopterin-binding protein [Microbacteriaceae bacterium]|nr:molybdopterin-binding protein [Microbacteriaceae bacterium]